MRPRTAADALEYPLAWLRDLGLSLEVSCTCGARSVIWLRGLADARPELAKRPFAASVAMLRCRGRCGQPLSRLTLFDVVERASAAAGYPCKAPWQLLLVGGDEPAG